MAVAAAGAAAAASGSVAGEAPEGSPEGLPDLALKGIEEFNRGEFYECHEYLEEAWMQEPGRVRFLYQGILQVGVGFHHLSRANLYGARSLWTRGVALLQPFRPSCMGVDVEALVLATERCLAELGRVEREGGAFDQTLIPRVKRTGEATGAS